MCTSAGRCFFSGIVFLAVAGLKCYNCRGDLASSCSTNYSSSATGQAECTGDQKCGLILEEFENGAGKIVR
jgi:hypothetical protein